MSGDDLVLLAAIGTGIVQLFKIVYVGLLGNPKPGKGFLRALVMVIAIGYGYLNTEIALPVLGDPMEFAVALVAAAGSILIVAHNAYKVILDPILGWLDEKVLRRVSALLAP